MRESSSCQDLTFGPRRQKYLWDLYFRAVRFRSCEISISCCQEFVVSPVVDGVTVARQRLGGGSRVHVASVGPSGHGRFGGVMLLHGRHGGPWAGALGSACSPFLLIGTVEHTHTHTRTSTHKCTRNDHVGCTVLGSGTSLTFFHQYSKQS